MVLAQYNNDLTTWDQGPFVPGSDNSGFNISITQERESVITNLTRSLKRGNLRPREGRQCLNENPIQAPLRIEGLRDSELSE